VVGLDRHGVVEAQSAGSAAQLEAAVDFVAGDPARADAQGAGAVQRGTSS
jgi:hypothetical protein